MQIYVRGRGPDKINKYIFWTLIHKFYVLHVFCGGVNYYKKYRNVNMLKQVL